MWWLADERADAGAPAAPLRRLVGLLDEADSARAGKRSREWRERFEEKLHGDA